MMVKSHSFNKTTTSLKIILLKVLKTSLNTTNKRKRRIDRYETRSLRLDSAWRRFIGYERQAANWFA